MNKMILIFLLLAAEYGHAQFKKKFDFEPSNHVVFYQYVDGHVSIGKNIKEDSDESMYIHSPRPSSGNKPIMQLTAGANAAGNYVELVNFGDTLYLYSQYVSKERDGDYMFYGELVKGDYSEVYSDYPLTDDYGEDLMNEDSTDYLYPEIFQMVPHGPWFERIDTSKYERGMYYKGKRDGKWNITSSKITTNGSRLILETKEYEDGMLVKSTDHNDLNKNWTRKQKEKSILGEWYSIGVSRSDMSIDREDLYLIYSRDSSMMRRSYYPRLLDYIDFKSKGTFNKKVSTSCGVGFKGNEDERRKEWKLDNENQLFLDGDTYQLVFLNENKMVLRFGN